MKTSEAPAMRSRTVLLIYVLLAVAVGGYQATLFDVGREMGRQFEFAWHAASWVLLFFWMQADWKEQRDVPLPFDFGSFFVLFWPFYLPYYLFRTRRSRAVWWLLGLIGLAFLGYALSWLVYTVRG